MNTFKNNRGKIRLKRKSTCRRHCQACSPVEAHLRSGNDYYRLLSLDAPIQALFTSICWGKGEGGWMGDRIAYCLMARQVKETETQSSRDQSVVTVVLRVEQIDRTEA